MFGSRGTRVIKDWGLMLSFSWENSLLYSSILGTCNLKAADSSYDACSHRKSSSVNHPPGTDINPKCKIKSDPQNWVSKKQSRCVIRALLPQFMSLKQESIRSSTNLFMCTSRCKLAIATVRCEVWYYCELMFDFDVWKQKHEMHVFQCFEQGLLALWCRTRQSLHL